MGKKKASKQPGIWKKKGPTDADADLKVADFSYQNPELAKLIVKAWKSSTFAKKIHDDPQEFKKELAKQPSAADPGPHLNLTSPVLIYEDEYEDGWEISSDDEVVFVLPNESRIDSNMNKDDLLEAAKMLMACVPNGI